MEFDPELVAFVLVSFPVAVRKYHGKSNLRQDFFGFQFQIMVHCCIELKAVGT